jgi:hypothetical protein
MANIGFNCITLGLLTSFLRNPEVVRDRVYIHIDRTSPVIIPESYRLTNCDERNPLVALVAGNARGLRIEDRLVVHQKLISMVAVRELDLDEPPAIHTAAHGMRSGVPRIEIAYQVNGLRRRCGTIEIDRFCTVFCGIPIGGAFVKHSVHQGRAANARRVPLNADADSESLIATVRPHFTIRAFCVVRAILTEDLGFEDCRKACRRA